MDAESLYCFDIPPEQRIARHLQYERYILEEVVPFTEQNPRWTPLIAHGCSFGAYHALTIAVRHPGVFQRVLAFSGRYDLTLQIGDYHSLFHGFYSEPLKSIMPSHSLPELKDRKALRLLRTTHFTLVVGEDDPFHGDNVTWPRPWRTRKSRTRCTSGAETHTASATGGKWRGFICKWTGMDPPMESHCMKFICKRHGFANASLSLIAVFHMALCSAHGNDPLTVTKTSKKIYNLKSEVKNFYDDLLSKNTDVKRQFNLLAAESRDGNGGDFQVFDPQIVEWFPTESHWDASTGFDSDEHYLVVQAIGFGGGRREGHDNLVISEFEVIHKGTTKYDDSYEKAGKDPALISNTVTIKFLGFRSPRLAAVKP